MMILLSALCISSLIDFGSSFGFGHGMCSSPSFVVGKGSLLLTNTCKYHAVNQLQKDATRRAAGAANRISSSRRELSMLKEPCGKDALVELASSKEVVPTAIRKTPSKLRKIAGSVSLPAVAVAGFVLTPGPSLVVHSVGAAISTIVGGIGKSRLSVESLRAVQPALAQLLLDNYPDWITNPSPTSTLVQQLQRDYQVTDPAEFMDIGMAIYRNYLVAMVKQPNAKTSDMAELTSLKQVLGLDNIALGEAHAQAAQQVYRETMTFTPEEELQDPQHPDRMSIDKLLFLSERAFRSGTTTTTSTVTSNGTSTPATSTSTDGAFIYEFSRVCKAFKIPSLQAGLQRVQSVAQPFYDRALSSTRTKLETGAVSPEMLARARATIGISDTLANDMHLSAFAQEVRSLLGRTTTTTSSPGTTTKSGTSDDDDDDNDDEEEDALETSSLSTDAGASIQFPPGALERLEKLRQVLNISEKDAQYEISVEACPLFQRTVQDILQKEVLASRSDDIYNDIDETQFSTWWQGIVTRQKELCIHQDNMIPLLDSIFTQILGAPLEEASTFASVNNEAAVYNKLLEALSIKARVSALLDHSNGVISASKYFDTDSMASCFQFLSSEMRKKLYSQFLSKSVRETTKKEHTSEDETLANVQQLLGISDDTAMDVSAIVCGPICQRALKDTADEVTSGDDVTPELIQQLKSRITNIIQTYRIPMDLVHKYQCEIYKNYLRFVHQNSPSGIPSAMFAQRLAHLQQLFDTMDSTQDIIPMHVATFGPSYKKSVLEAMGITGVILPEYRQPLQKLRDRLGVGEEEAHKLFLSAISEKLVPMVQRIEYELERLFLTKEQVARKRGKDIGEDVFAQGSNRGDLGIGTQGNIMSDILNLVDFYTENDVPIKVPKQKSIDGGHEKNEEDIETTAVEANATTIPATDEEEEIKVEEMDVTYPVTAIGLKAVEPEMAEAMYHQFLVGGFSSSQQQQAARYEAAAPIFGGILGLSKERMEAVGGNVGSAVYENFITNVLQTKTSMDQQDMMFLAQIQSKLKISSEKAQEMLIEAEKKVLKGQAQRLFDAKTILPSDIQGFRERCNGMGIDIHGDLGISKERVAALFIFEITEGIERGSITTDSGAYLTEIQESLGLSQDECEQAVVGLVQQRIPEYLDKIDKELLRGREDQCIDPIKKIVRFASLVGGDVDVEVRKDRAYKIVSLFEAADFSEESPEDLEAQKQILKTALGLGEST